MVEERGPDHPLANQRSTPRGPLLQAHPTKEIEVLRAEQQRVLGSLDWIDPQEGIVRLPIDLAKEVYLQRQAKQAEEPGG